MMEFLKPKEKKWSDQTGAELTIRPDFGTADFLLTIAEDAMLNAEPNSEQRKNAENVLKQLYENELIECDHSYTERVEVDDTRWLEQDGVHERENEDETRCLICGAIYNQKEETWE